jgi:hypothetical protein
MSQKVTKTIASDGCNRAVEQKPLEKRESAKIQKSNGNFKLFTMLAFMLVVFVFSGCKKDNDHNEDSIYNDALAVPNPVLSSTNINIPNPTFMEEADNVIRMDMSGILNPFTREWIELASPSPSSKASGVDVKAYIYIEVDAKAKHIPSGVGVVNNSEGSGNKREADVVFLVDNSGSMSEEANGVAVSIVDFAKYLSEQKIDVQFGCVGYESGVNGALNLTDTTGIKNYLNRSTGTSRTYGFSGTDAATLQTSAQSYQHGYDECGSEAFRYADENFSFRNSSSIIYLNFTDEPNQPGGFAEYGVEWTKDPSKWKQQRGTIHTVFSADTTYWYGGEKPWLMSEYTGGTTLLVNSSFTSILSGGVANAPSLKASNSDYISLLDLPVTGAMVHSYIVRFKNNSTVPDGKHEVKITIQSADKTVQGEKIIKNVTFGKSL